MDTTAQFKSDALELDTEIIGLLWLQNVSRETF